MNFMEEINKETQAMLKQISIRKAEKTANAKKRIAELKKLIKFWEQDYGFYEVRECLSLEWRVQKTIKTKTKRLYKVRETIYRKAEQTKGYPLEVTT